VARHRPGIGTQIVRKQKNSFKRPKDAGAIGNALNREPISIFYLADARLA
jgi:hypothetical protein